jgi:hypothetical protein
LNSEIHQIPKQLTVVRHTGLSGLEPKSRERDVRSSGRRKVDVGLVFDLPAMERATQGREFSARGNLCHVVELGVRSLCAE